MTIIKYYFDKILNLLSFRFITFILIFTMLFTGGFVLLSCGRTKTQQSQEQMSKKIKYHCPMHPTYISDKPGDCPICGMKLVPIEEKKDIQQMQTSKVPGLSTVHIPVEKQQLIGIKTDTVRYLHLTKIIRATGKTAHDPELYNAQKEYLEALRTREKVKNSPIPEILERANSLVLSARLRLNLIGINDKQIEELEKQNQTSVNLLLPHHTDKVWLHAQIYEYEIGLIKTGQLLKAYSKAFPDKIFTGVISSIDPMLNPETRTLRIRAELNNPDGLLKHEMFVNVEINIDFGYVLSIPKESVLDSGIRKIIFVYKGDGLFEPREVKLKVETDDYYEVVSGVKEGEKIVSSANFLVDSESKLKSALSQMSSE